MKVVDWDIQNKKATERGDIVANMLEARGWRLAKKFATYALWDRKESYKIGY